jgi:DNA-binding MarR family transcriptional regulator
MTADEVAKQIDEMTAQSVAELRADAPRNLQQLPDVRVGFNERLRTRRPQAVRRAVRGAALGGGLFGPDHRSQARRDRGGGGSARRPATAQHAGVAPIHLDHEPGLSSADLARAMGVTAQAANLLVANMERERLVRRSPHPTHGRVLETYATEEGLRRLRLATPFVQNLEARLLQGLQPDQSELIHHWLVDAARAVGASPGRGRQG